MLFLGFYAAGGYPLAKLQIQLADGFKKVLTSQQQYKQLTLMIASQNHSDYNGFYNQNTPLFNPSGKISYVVMNSNPPTKAVTTQVCMGQKVQLNCEEWLRIREDLTGFGSGNLWLFECFAKRKGSQ